LDLQVHTGISETTIRSWNKIGISKKGNSRRLSIFPAKEEELLKIFKNHRNKGMAQI